MPVDPPAIECSRLAPSPTGALHLGNARTFLINWALARRNRWKLILRIEDLDTPRVKAGAVEGIMGTLRWLGIDWDASPGGMVVQSQDLDPYRHAMRRLAAAGLAYPCTLSRTEIEAAASAPQEGSHEVRFPTHLRPPAAVYDFDAEEARAGEEGTNWRFVVPPGDVAFSDVCAGPRRFDIAAIVGDFIIWTKRRQPAYQLAVVVDDHRQGVTQVVRGDDLLDSAARQLLLYRALSQTPEPTYTHLPLVIGADGRRLAKRHGDTRVETYRARGVPTEAVIGLIASWSGVLPAGSPRCMPPAEFMERFDLTTMSRQSVTFTPEDDRWLVSQARRG